MKTTQTLYLNEPKKHSVRYDAGPGESEPLLTSIYVSKTHLPRPIPDTIVVTVETPGA